MHDPLDQQTVAAALDEYLDCLLQEELADLCWSQAEVEAFTGSPLPALIKEIVVATVINVWSTEGEKDGCSTSASVARSTNPPHAGPILSENPTQSTTGGPYV